MTPARIKRPQIHMYGNHRDFLRDMYLYLKQTVEGGYTYRRFSQDAGFRSSNVLKQVIDGKRNFAADSCLKAAKALRLRNDETDYFVNLVLLNQSRSEQERRYFSKQIIKTTQYAKAHPIQQAEYRYYANWYNVAIRELIAHESFRDDPEWISSMLVPKVNVRDVQKAMKDLETLNYIKKEKGKWVQAAGILSTGDEVVSTTIKDFHFAMIDKGKESIDRFAKEHRDISCLTLGLSAENVQRLKQLIQDFRKECLVLAGTDQKAKGVYQLNFQMFPLTKEGTNNEG